MDKDDNEFEEKIDKRFVYKANGRDWLHLQKKQKRERGALFVQETLTTATTTK